MSFVGVGALAANATTVTLSITAPTLQADDIMVAAVLLKSNLVVDPPDGTWTEFVQAMNTAAQKVVLWWKRAAAGDSGASFIFSKDIDDNILFCGVISAWRGRLKAGDPLAGSSTSANASSDTVTYASLDPTAACDLVAVGCYNQDLTTAGAISGTDPTFTNRWDLETPGGSDASIFGYSGDSTGAATGARSHSTSSSADAINVGVLFGLLPEPEPAAYEPSQWLGGMVNVARRRSVVGFRLKRGLLHAGAFEPQAPEPLVEESGGGGFAPAPRRRSRWTFPRRALPAAEFEEPEGAADFDFGGGLVRGRLPRWRFPRRAPWPAVEFEPVVEVVDFDAGGGLVHAARRRTFSGWRFRAGVRPGGFEFEGLEPEPEAPVVERRPLSEYVKFELGHRQGIKFDRR